MAYMRISLTPKTYTTTDWKLPYTQDGIARNIAANVTMREFARSEN